MGALVLLSIFDSIHNNVYCLISIDLVGVQQEYVNREFELQKLFFMNNQLILLLLI